MASDPDPEDARWWREAVVYQIYPRSFADSNGDGIGDLPGITAHLEHLVRLGVDALWLTPIYPSGGADGGYDVTDYLSVDPVYGDLDDLDRLIEAAHDRGLRVILDFVPNHTSTGHPWFLESRSSRDSPRRNWYVWADGRDGGPPNNWLSVFTGPAWVYDEATGQYFLASFYPEQADLNWANPEVRSAAVDAMRFWVGHGVDGFRIDVVHRLAKDPDLRDNPPEAAPAGGPQGIARYDENLPHGHDYVREIRAALGPDVLLLGEVWILDMREIVGYLGPDQLDLAFNFPFAFAPWNARPIAALVAQAESLLPAGTWPCYHLSNHDTPRHGTRFGQAAIPAAAVMLLTLRGTPILYQGEEIGMLDVPVPPEAWTDRMGRDSARTPMQWDTSPNAGFCPPAVRPWLPVAEDASRRNVASQEADPSSVLSLYRRLLSLRRRSPALARGEYRQVAATREAYLYLREAGPERLLVALNLGSRETEVRVSAGTVVLATRPEREGERQSGTFTLRGHEAVVLALDPA